MKTWIREHPIVAIMRNVPWELTEAYANTVVQGGIRAIEVALNSLDAVRQIAFLRQHLDASVAVGAGTAVTVQKAEAALEAGADFLLTPSADEEVLRFCAQEQIRLLPGVMTPTDVSRCVQYGFTTMKLFPAGDLPLGYLKSLQGPFDGTDYVAVGGVNIKNVRQFFDAGFLGVGVGSNLISKEFAARHDWQAAQEQVRRFVEQAMGVEKF